MYGLRRTEASAAGWLTAVEAGCWEPVLSFIERTRRGAHVNVQTADNVNHDLACHCTGPAQGDPVSADDNDTASRQVSEQAGCLTV